MQLSTTSYGTYFWIRLLIFAVWKNNPKNIIFSRAFLTADCSGAGTVLLGSLHALGTMVAGVVMRQRVLMKKLLSRGAWDVDVWLQYFPMSLADRSFDSDGHCVALRMCMGESKTGLLRRGRGVCWSGRRWGLHRAHRWKLRQGYEPKECRCFIAPTSSNLNPEENEATSQRFHHWRAGLTWPNYNWHRWLNHMLKPYHQILCRSNCIPERPFSILFLAILGPWLWRGPGVSIITLLPVGHAQLHVGSVCQSFGCLTLQVKNCTFHPRPSEDRPTPKRIRGVNKHSLSFEPSGFLSQNGTFIIGTSIATNANICQRIYICMRAWHPKHI